jgi:hypothetical protein
MSVPDKFWWVWREHGGIPTVRHASRGQAEHEAQRLARQCPGESFFILEAISVTRKVDVETITLRDEGMPF